MCSTPRAGPHGARDTMATFIKPELCNATTILFTGNYYVDHPLVYTIRVGHWSSNYVQEAELSDGKRYISFKYQNRS